MNKTSRRDFLEMTGAVGVALMVPASVACTKKETVPASSPLDVPQTRPADWDPIAFNRTRGNAGAIPESYRAKINGPDGATQHIGKHLPYVPGGRAPTAGFLALMWGDASRGNAKHPNAKKSEALPTGHWFDWIRVRRAVPGEAEEHESRYSDWPATAPADSGRLAAFEGTDPAADDGKNTVYLVALPRDVKPGDLIRVHGHCLTHGEYVDFLQVPA